MKVVTPYNASQMAGFRNAGQRLANQIIAGSRSVAMGTRNMLDARPIAGVARIGSGALLCGAGVAGTAVTMAKEGVTAFAAVATNKPLTSTPRASLARHGLPPAIQSAHDTIQYGVWNAATGLARTTVGGERAVGSRQLLTGATELAVGAVGAIASGAADAATTFRRAR